jgi:nucleoside-diphosphate-sugar epimerase
VVDGYLFLLNNFSRVKGEAFNFSSINTLSVLDVVKKAEQIFGVKIPYKILNIAKNEIPYQHLDDFKIRKLGWKNNYSFTSTLPKIIEWYKNRL